LIAVIFLLRGRSAAPVPPDEAGPMPWSAEFLKQERERMSDDTMG
jgi:hypothetical protein